MSSSEVPKTKIRENSRVEKAVWWKMDESMSSPYWGHGVKEKGHWTLSVLGVTGRWFKWPWQVGDEGRNGSLTQALTGLARTVLFVFVYFRLHFGVDRGGGWVGFLLTVGWLFAISAWFGLFVVHATRFPLVIFYYAVTFAENIRERFVLIIFLVEFNQ